LKKFAEFWYSILPQEFRSLTSWNSLRSVNPVHILCYRISPLFSTHLCSPIS